MPPQDDKTDKASAVKKPAKPAPKSTETKPTATQPTIDDRINALIEQKARLDAAVVTANAAADAALEAVPTGLTLAPAATVGKTRAIEIEVYEETETVTVRSSSKKLDVAALRAQSKTSLLVEPTAETSAAKEADPEVLTVTDLNKGIKSLLEKTYPFLWVKGEISNLKIPSSGHLYFTLKDSNSQIRAVMFRGFAQGLKFKPEDGMEVLIRCKVTAYEPRGDYQLFCEVMEPVGFGALQIAFEKLKAKLQSEGLFDQKRKRPLPAFPNRIGLITSPTGAAIRDMLNVLGRRMGGGLDITIIPTSVQGDKAPAEIIRAIQTANRLGTERFDVLIIGRGGGSLEDMWSFNIEEVVRAVAASAIPTISAVGHEVDFTICDFVADLRAPTPSAAAELVVKNKRDLLERIELLQRQVTQQMGKRFQLSKNRAENLAKRLIDPKRRLQDLMLRCDEWSERLALSMNRFIQDNAMAVKFLRERLGSPAKRLELCEQRFLGLDQRLKTSIEAQLQKKQNAFSKLAALLNGLSPLSILARGYSIMKMGDKIISQADQVKKDDVVTITLHKGQVTSKIQ